MQKFLFVILALWFVCCGGPQHTNQSIYGSDFYQDACNKLIRICPDPIPVDECAFILESNKRNGNNSKLSKYTPNCILDSSDKTDAESCPGVRVLCSK